MLVIAGILFYLAASCSLVQAPTPLPTADGVLLVDPIFREFYGYLGGSEVLGQPISNRTQEGDAIVQYMEKAKLVFDAMAPAKLRFGLAPVGAKMGIAQPTVSPPDQPGTFYFDGHYIAPEFIPLYEKLSVFAGRPVTEPIYNPARQRYEQYFENVGFYRLEGSDEVHLLDYGLWACKDACFGGALAGGAPRNATIDVYPQVDETFAPFVNQLGGDFTGFAISDAYLNRDGKWEQIFSNVVLQADAAGDVESVRLRPLTQDLNILPEQPRPNSQNPDYHFYPVSGDKGFEVPLYFWDYILAHGGEDMFGPPVSHLGTLKGGVLHQCFTNLCLMYDPKAIEESRVGPEPLGYAFKALNRPGQRSGAANQAAGSSQVKLWERHPVIASGQPQGIGVSVTEKGQPVSGVVPYLQVTLPDGRQKSYSMPPTSAQGLSELTIEPVQAANGTLILYRVCVPLAQQPDTCVGDSFVIWDNP
jgi:hypothetical protein